MRSEVGKGGKTADNADGREEAQKARKRCCWSEVSGRGRVSGLRLGASKKVPRWSNLNVKLQLFDSVNGYTPGSPFLAYARNPANFLDRTRRKIPSRGEDVQSRRSHHDGHFQFSQIAYG
jgi:hypothetical protein